MLYACMLSYFSRFWLCDPIECILPGSSVNRFSRQEFWSGFPCPPPEDFPNPGTEPVSLMSPALAGGFLTASTTWEAPISRISQFSRSVVSDSLWPHGLQLTRPPCPSPTPSLLKLMSIELVMPSNHLILCCPLLLPPSIFTSIRVFSNESVLHVRWPKYWSFSFNRQNSGPPKMSMSWSLEPVNMFPYMAEQILQRWWRILRWGNYLGLSKWAQYNHRVIIKERGR